MVTYLSTVDATRVHTTWLAYNLILNEFRKTCAKEYLGQIDKTDLTAFVVAQKKEGQDDRTVANRVAGVVTFLRENEVAADTLFDHQFPSQRKTVHRDSSDRFPILCSLTLWR